MAKRMPMGLGKREQQIVNAIHQVGEASVAEVRTRLADPPSYSAVRALLGILVEKGMLKVRKDGRKYLYKPRENAKKARKNAVQSLMETFFGNSPVEAIATLLDVSSSDLSKDEIDRLRKMIGELDEGKSSEERT